jgi:hypothetical protein
MATTKTKEELVRMNWLVELRRQGDRQCHHYGSREEGKACAMQILSEIVCGDVCADYVESGYAAGLSVSQMTKVTDINDDGGTFSEIADVVESWFSK